MISRGLLISVGVTLLAVGLLFVYFRNKVSGIEKKVELMFNLIQNYDGQQNVSRAYVPSGPQEESYPQPNVQNLKSELIEVSDDEDDDSEVVSDSDDDSDEEEQTLKFEPTNIELKEEDVKTIQLEELNQQNNDDSLDDDSDDEEEDDDDDDNEEEVQHVEPPQEEELEAVEVVELTEDDYKKKNGCRVKKDCWREGITELSLFKKSSFNRVIDEPVALIVVEVELNVPYLLNKLKNLILGNLVSPEYLQLLNKNENKNKNEN